MSVCVQHCICVCMCVCSIVCVFSECVCSALCVCVFSIVSVCMHYEAARHFTETLHAVLAAEVGYCWLLMLR